MGWLKPLTLPNLLLINDLKNKKGARSTPKPRAVVSQYIAYPKTMYILRTKEFYLGMQDNFRETTIYLAKNNRLNNQNWI
jgi:hypothetical protein